MVLSLAPEDAQSLMVVRSVGELFLTLRAYGDEVVEDLSPITAKELFGEEPIPPATVIWRVTGAGP